MSTSNIFSPGDTDNNMLRKLLNGFSTGAFSVTTSAVEVTVEQAVVTQPNPALLNATVQGTVGISGTVLTDSSAHTQPVSGTVGISGTVPVSVAGKVSTEVADGPSVDAFGRLRTATPAYIFDSQFTYNIAPLLWEPITNGSGATVAHDATNRCALMTFASTPTGGKAYLQTYEHFRYQPGRSQLVMTTFNFIEAVANVTKFIGYSDGTNGIEFQLSGSTPQFVVLSGTANGNQTVAQSSWNLDKLNGTGPSGVTVDFTKCQILVIDFQALYVGRVRIGFDLGGVIVYAHQFIFTNSATVPYIQSANLPMRAGMTCTGTVSTTMRYICCSVSSGGGQDEVVGYFFTATGSVTAASGTRTHVLSIRPKTTFNSIANRSKFVLEGIELVDTGSNPIYWELCVGQAISGTTTYNDVNTTYSGFEYNTAGTISGSPAVVLASGFISASNQSKESTSLKINGRFPITLDSSGAVRALGTITLLVTGLTGSSACQVALNWREIR